MKIERTGSVGSTPIKRSEKSKSGGSGKFAEEVGASGGGNEPVSGTAPVHAADALLAIQEVEDTLERGPNARARQWGGEVLDRLEVIRIGLLAGGIPVSELRNIAALVRRQREAVTDPRLQELLDEIELRARVELAKYDRDA